MSIDLELLIAFVGSLAALLSALFVFYKWAVDQENARLEQLRHDIRNEVRAEIYRELLRLNVQWLSQSEAQRETIERLSGQPDEQGLEDRTDEEIAQSSSRSS